MVSILPNVPKKIVFGAWVDIAETIESLAPQTLGKTLFDLGTFLVIEPRPDLCHPAANWEVWAQSRRSLRLLEDR